MKTSVIIKTYETEAHRVSLKGDGITRVYSKPKHIVESDITRLIEKFKEIGDGKRLLVLIDPTEENSMSDEAKNQIIVNLGTVVFAVAVMNKKKYITQLGNLFLKSKRLSFSLKMFTDENKAVDWLNEIDLK